LRYSALLFGVFYGFSHQRTIYANAKAAHAEHEYKHKEALIQKAKAEFAKKNLPPQAKTADGGGEFLGQFNMSCHSWLLRIPSDPKWHIC
jgi:F-type H+-transporting ATP synthase subunit e